MGRTFLRRLHAGSALVLMLLFFVGAAASVIALGWAGEELVQGSIHHARGRAMIFGIIIGLALIGAALVIAWSLLPRFDTFTAPGPELHRDQHPALFREIDRIAARTGETAPAHVYLVPDVNAFVAERGGLMGVGAKRIMGLGLPLLNVLTVGELRAVLSHEFGHYAGGDIGFGRWIHKARIALMRTLDNLGSTAEAVKELGTAALVFVVIHAPFRWFFAFYMRFTLALSRRQEFDADALAVRLEGSRALVGGLEKTRRAGLAYSAYLNQELSPLLSRGLLPPVGAGFQQFLTASSVTEVLSKLLAEQQAADPYDSHPPLHLRVEHATRLGGASPSADERLAIALLADVPVMELALAQLWAERKYERVEWERLGQVDEDDVRAWAKKTLGAFSGVTLSGVSVDMRSLRVLCGHEFSRDVVTASSNEQIAHWAVQFLSRTMQVALLAQGFAAFSRPGHPTVMRREGEEVEPFAVSGAFVAGTLSHDAWLNRLTTIGIGAVDVATLAV